eukprot:TRINITY_DN44649_c0_g1_i1.p1 TRINITY_DN44649_c0_g1~~TRINITY_DN44649_c0_g1_i1.p1  ORF type:complete len:365 (+),score=27.93 TRINITY_DN44649_c0_g1_i1:24-1097(+)
MPVFLARSTAHQSFPKTQMRRCIFVSTIFSVLASASWAWLDCDESSMRDVGPFGEMSQFNDTADDGSVIFVLHPEKFDQLFPVMVFSHGTTGEFAMYESVIRRYVSHGFVVIHPHVKGPTKDTSPFTLDPGGDFAIKGVHYAQMAASNTSNKLYRKLDVGNLVLAGHSMGASTTIMAAKRLPVGTAKVAIAQHPGVCGPFGPPPWPSTWMPSDFEKVSGKMPIILTTATNDGAFWPAPYTAPHELGCFHKSTDASATKAATAFIQFSEQACVDDGTGGRYDRKWSTGGHDCPMKVSVETPWVLVAAKLYGQFDGESQSQCYRMLWGSGASSLQHDLAIEKFVVNPPGSQSLIAGVMV